MLCYLTSSSSLPWALSALRFKENTAVQIHDEIELRAARENGLHTFYDCCDDGFAAIDADFVQFDYRFLTDETLATLKPQQVIIVKIAVYGLPDVFSEPAGRETITALLKRDYAINFHVERIPSTHEISSTFAWAPANSRIMVSQSDSIQPSSWSAFNNPLTLVQFRPSPELSIGMLLKKRKHRIAVLEATTGGSIAAALLSVPGASAFFISCAVVYTGRGAKRILPPEVLQASALFDRDNNYSGRANYVQSKVKYCQAVSQAMRTAMKADFVIVESGTTGPDFYISGVEAFTAVGVAGPNGFVEVKIFDSSSRDRQRNMQDFKDFGLRTLHEALMKYDQNEALMKYDQNDDNVTASIGKL